MAKLRIGVLYDYFWDEDEVRVEGERPKKKSPDEDIQAVYEALKKTGHNPVYVRLDGTSESLIELARSQSDLLFNLTESFAGIRPADAPGFIVAQLVGGASAGLLFRWLHEERS